VKVNLLAQANMKFLLSIGPMLRMAALVVALSQANAAENKRDALTIRVAQGGWGDASVENIEQVLRSAAEQIHRFCPVTPKPILVEHGSGSPIVFYRKGPNGETLVKLNVTGRYWAQFAYQFAHELCHICCGYQNNQGRTNLNQWFEESLCETASLFAIRRMAVAWKTNPPYPNWRDFAKHLDSYAANLLEAPERKLPPGTTFASWFVLNESKLRENGGCNRTLNGVVANNVLLPLLEKNPENWGAMASLNEHSTPPPGGFAEYLAAWQSAAPQQYHGFIKQIGAAFGMKPLPSAAPQKQ